ncbi:diacylglycerol kinase family protein [Microbacterium sp. zg-YB36]|uniref:diacylglycerol/lipid kinase family protein n=1 Tax=Microbacterium sp. zg-YB36 TaxID=2969407 RepID=UPI00214C6CEB|nr:diacylglycerol kinase family protein [Microbacterium sp. zg-YB36]MDL5352672.1 diacylglycerol kinase family protein [Microbacterium sp. zg-YB36]
MPDDTAPARPDGEGLLLLANSGAGEAVPRADPLPVIRTRLPRAQVRELGPDDDLGDAVAQAMACDDRPGALGVLGGDGSVSRMAQLARQYDVPLLVLPGGTFNHFARSAGLDDVDAALAAFTAGTLRDVVVAEVAVDGGEPITVLNAVSLGTYPQFLAERTERANLGKWLGGLGAIRSALREAQPVRVSHEGRTATVWSVFVGVGRNDPQRHAMMQRLSLEDPVLDVRLHHARGSRLRAMTTLAFGRRTLRVLRALRVLPPASEFERQVAEHWRVRVLPGRAPAVYVHDGELEEASPAGFTLDVRAVPAGLRIYAP